MTPRLRITCEGCEKDLGFVVSNAQARRIMRIHSHATGHVTKVEDPTRPWGAEFLLPARKEGGTKP